MRILDFARLELMELAQPLLQQQMLTALNMIPACLVLVREGSTHAIGLPIIAML